MTSSYDNSTAIVVLPRVAGRLGDSSLRSWLARADVVRAAGPRELLRSVLHEIHRPYPDEGLAALRIWGQTGDRPTVWIAGADPVYLEPRLDHLFLHAVQGGVQPTELRSLFDHLQETLGDDGGIGFARVGQCGYLNSARSMVTATLPACAVDQCVPDEFLPRGDQAGAHRTLSSEIEMALHDHAINIDRQGQGLQPINALWIWGGGRAPEQVTEYHPPLFSDDPLLRGYWASKTGVTESWPGSIAACLDLAVTGFVAVAPEIDDDLELLESSLNELRLALKSRRLRQLILLFRDGVYADVRRSQAVRVWRRDNPLIDGTAEVGVGDRA